MSSKIILPSTSYAKSLLASSPSPQNSAGVTSTITALSLQPHPEGGFFVETDRDPRRVPNPFLDEDTSTTDKANIDADGASAIHDPSDSNYSATSQADNYIQASKQSSDLTRNASTTIHYLLSPSSPLGRFHRNKARTVHTLHWGRGAYVVLHPAEHDEMENDRGVDGKAERREGKMEGISGEGWRMETFIVGKDVVKDERVQWIVEGGRYKASYLLPDTGGGNEDWDDEDGSTNGLLISETVVPGFEFSDHDFLTAEKFLRVVEKKGLEEMRWLLGREEGSKLESSGAF